MNFKKMEDFKKRANEGFFTNVINLLNEGGFWGWKAKPHLVFKKRNGKLECSQEGYEAVSEIISKKFLEENFKKEKP